MARITVSNIILIIISNQRIDYNIAQLIWYLAAI